MWTRRSRARSLAESRNGEAGHVVDPEELAVETGPAPNPPGPYLITALNQAECYLKIREGSNSIASKSISIRVSVAHRLDDSSGGSSVQVNILTFAAQVPRLSSELLTRHRLQLHFHLRNLEPLGQSSTFTWLPGLGPGCGVCLPLESNSAKNSAKVQRSTFLTWYRVPTKLTTCKRPSDLLCMFHNFLRRVVRQPRTMPCKILVF
jgi:hypothetical protein